MVGKFGSHATQTPARVGSVVCSQHDITNIGDIIYYLISTQVLNSKGAIIQKTAIKERCKKGNASFLNIVDEYETKKTQMNETADVL